MLGLWYLDAHMPKRYMFVYTLSEHVFFQSMTGPALCEPAASVVSALASVLYGIDVLLFGVHVFAA